MPVTRLSMMIPLAPDDAAIPALAAVGILVMVMVSLPLVDVAVADIVTDFAAPVTGDNCSIRRNPASGYHCSYVCCLVKIGPTCDGCAGDGGAAGCGGNNVEIVNTPSGPGRARRQAPEARLAQEQPVVGPVVNLSNLGARDSGCTTYCQPGRYRPGKCCCHRDLVQRRSTSSVPADVEVSRCARTGKVGVVKRAAVERY